MRYNVRAVPHPHLHPLPEVSSIFGGLSAKAEADPLLEKHFGDEMRCAAVGLRAIAADGLDLSRLDSVFPPSPLQKNELQIQPGDVLLAARGTEPRAAIAPTFAEPQPLYISSNVFLLRPNPDVLLPETLWAWLTSPAGRAAIERVAHSSTRQMVITRSVLDSLVIPVPSIEEQQALAAVIRAAQTAYTAALEAAEQARRVLFAATQHAFQIEK